MPTNELDGDNVAAGMKFTTEYLKQHLQERLLRCVEMMLASISRDWESCGKASCARSRRCRGFVCEPGEEYDT